MPLRLLHISDLHFGPFFLPDVAESLRTFAHASPLDAIIATGDFTQRAKLHQFEEARDFLEKLPKVPLLCIPGNHDVPLYRIFERVLSPYDLYRRYIDNDLSPVLQLPGCVIAGINTTAPLRAISEGRVDWKQLEKCRSLFEQAPEGSIRIVAAHHHFAPAPDFERSTAIAGAKEALEFLLESKAEIILGGHLHRSYIGNSLDVYPAGNRSSGIIVVQCGATTCRRGRGKEREKNSLNVIEVDDRTIRVRHYLYFRESNHRFVPMSDHLFPRRNTMHL